MKILIIGSMAFAREMVKIKEELKKMGHEADIPYGTEPHLTDDKFVDSLEDNLKFCIENDVMRKNFQEVAKHDAVLVLNHKRNGTDGYIGISALMEMAIAHYLHKKVFLFNDIPHYNNVRWAHEVSIMQPVVIKRDLSRIK